MFKDILSGLLKKSGINTFSLSKQIGVPKSIVYEWMQGKREPSMENLIKLSEFFNVTLEELTGRPLPQEGDENERELLLLLREAKGISEDDHNALINSFKANIDEYLKINSVSRLRKEHIKNEAVKLLLLQELKGEYALSFLNLRHINTGGIATVDSISSYENRLGITLPSRADGMTLQLGGINMILYDDKIGSQGRINWTIAHELGHIILNHTEQSSLNEREADIFASSLLMPKAVIAYLTKTKKRPLKLDDMQSYFSASNAAAERRMKEITDFSFTFTDDENELIKRLFNQKTVL